MRGMLRIFINLAPSSYQIIHLEIIDMKDFIKKYKHAWICVYVVFYMPWFMYLESHVTTDYTVLHLPIDDKIPFCEYFIIPYYLWFAFVPAVMLYLILYSKDEFYRAAIFLFTGMTLFLIICTFWHNGLNLRDVSMYNDNIFSDIVKKLHQTDTNTNVFPSMHVFNTLGCLIALYKSKGLEGHGITKALATVLSALIILSTVFLKQHSIIDVIGGFGLAALMYLLAYVPDWESILNNLKKNRTSN